MKVEMWCTTEVKKSDKPSRLGLLECTLLAMSWFPFVTRQRARVLGKTWSQ